MFDVPFSICANIVLVALYIASTIYNRLLSTATIPSPVASEVMTIHDIMHEQTHKLYFQCCNFFLLSELKLAIVTLAVHKLHRIPELAAIMASITDESSRQDRIDAGLPFFKQCVQMHENGQDDDGCEAMNYALMKKIKECKLMTLQQVQLEHVGTHPDNREKHMLVGIDVQDLLMKFAKKGYNPDIWKALALAIPFGPAGQEWRDANERLVQKSDGLLPAINGDMLSIVCGRGSHGTAALRAGKFGCKSVYSELADSKGMVSKTKLLDLQSSLREPFDNGCWYQVLPGELELQCPGLFALLSRLGNASNSSFRMQTTLQYCNRIHELATGSTNPNWDMIQKVASHGVPDDMIQHMQKLCSFVKAWGGGSSGSILKDLEAYEKTLQVRRKLAPEHLDALAKLEKQMLEYGRFVSVTHSACSSHFTCLLGGGTGEGGSDEHCKKEI